MAPRKRKTAEAAPIDKASKDAYKKAKPDSPSQAALPYTTNAARKCRQPSCSLASLRSLENEETIEANFIGLFGTQSDNHYTWGRTEAKPIIATKRRGAKAPRFRIRASGNMPAGLFPFLEGSPEPIIPNSPDRSPFLRIPLEVRERVYSYLLIYKSPIIVRHDWATVEHKFFRSHKIIFLCKQISIEASAFLYKNNVFRAILRNHHAGLLNYDAFSIAPQFLPLFRNVIIECERENYHFDWFEAASLSVEKLHETKVVLNSLTLVLSPQRVGLSTTAIGMEGNPITFADFFYPPGRLMVGLRKLNCRFLNVVVKKYDGEGRRRRFLISLDLSAMQAREAKEGSLANKETVMLARAKAETVERELLGLKKRFEDIFEDDDWAVGKGKCRLLGEDENYINGMALAKTRGN